MFRVEIFGFKSPRTTLMSLHVIPRIQNRQKNRFSEVAGASNVAKYTLSVDLWSVTNSVDGPVDSKF